MAEKVIVMSLDASSSFATQLVFLLVNSKPNYLIQAGALPRTTRIRRTVAMSTTPRCSIILTENRRNTFVAEKAPNVCTFGE